LRQAILPAIAVFAAVAGQWFLAVLALGALAFVLVHRLWLRDRQGVTSQLAAAAVCGVIAVALIGIGVYALGFSRLPYGAGLVFLIAALVPASYFLLLAWGIAYGGITGRRPPGADRVNSFFVRANQPLGPHRRR